MARRFVRIFGALAVAASALACLQLPVGPGPFEPRLDGEGRRALFIGNSYTYAAESYTLAAADVSGLLWPVAAGWIATWDGNSNVELYADDLHPSAAGAYLSALVIYSRLLGKSPVGLPRTLRLHSGATISIDATLAATLQAAAAEVTTSP
jgi:hypothetical protein